MRIDKFVAGAFGYFFFSWGLIFLIAGMKDWRAIATLSAGQLFLALRGALK